MNTHKHARLTFARRIEKGRRMTEQGLNATQAAAAQGVTAPTARKWLSRFLARRQRPEGCDITSESFTSQH